MTDGGLPIAWAIFGLSRRWLDEKGPLTYTPYPMRSDVLSAMHQLRRGTFLPADRAALMRPWLDRGLLTKAEAVDLLGPAVTPFPTLKSP